MDPLKRKLMEKLANASQPGLIGRYIGAMKAPFQTYDRAAKAAITNKMVKTVPGESGAGRIWRYMGPGGQEKFLREARQAGALGLGTLGAGLGTGYLGYKGLQAINPFGGSGEQR
jgi:hypothetical protein